MRFYNQLAERSTAHKPSKAQETDASLASHVQSETSDCLKRGFPWPPEQPHETFAVLLLQLHRGLAPNTPG